jgi:hypothetical protein
VCHGILSGGAVSMRDQTRCAAGVSEVPSHCHTTVMRYRLRGVEILDREDAER